MSDAVERIEAKVEATLGQALEARRPVIAIGSLIAAGIVASLVIANLVLYALDSQSRNAYRRVTNSKIEWQNRQLVGIACLLMVPSGDRTINDAVRCEVAYIPGQAGGKP